MIIQDTTALYDNVIAILSYFAYEIILFFRNITLSLLSKIMFRMDFSFGHHKVL